MTRIGIRAGHTTRSCGSSGILIENDEARKVKSEVIKILSKYAEIIDLQPPEDMAYPDELNYGINKANSIDNMDLAFSIHFNNAYDNYSGAIGTETHIYPNSKAYGSAKGITDKLASLGFKNRGVYQDGSKYGEPRCSNVPWIIIEVCFVEATKDAEIYRSVGPSGVAKAIVEGIIGQSIQEITVTNKDKGYIVTNYLPPSYEGYDGINVAEITKAYFDGITTYVRSNSQGSWIETQYLNMDKCEELKKTLGSLFYEIKY